MTMRAERDGDDVDDRWVLHASDRTLLGNKTGATRLGFAVLLKMFHANGRFPYRLEEVPVAAVEAIASQIEVPAVKRCARHFCAVTCTGWNCGARSMRV